MARPPKNCVVPSLAGQTLAAAKTALKAANCAEGTVTKKASSTVPKGDVISSSPGGGDHARAAAKVALTISSGKAKAKGGGKAPTNKACKVPALKGKTLTLRKKALKKAHCGVGTVRTRRPRRSRRARSFRASPGKGAKKKAGAKVKLTVSSGKKAASGPEVVQGAGGEGQDAGGGKEGAEEGELRGRDGDEEGVLDRRQGQGHLEQARAGTKHKAGTKVALTVSSGKPTPPKKTCTVPNVVGDTLAAAKAALKKANCSTGTVTNKASSKVAKGKVISSSPKAGTKHKAGTKVKLTVSSGPGYSVPKS